MEELFLSRDLSTAEVQTCLQMVMPGFRAFEWNMMRYDWPSEFDPDSDTHLSFSLEQVSFETDPQVFPRFVSRLTVYRTPEADSEQRALWLAKIFSIRYEVAVMVAFKHPDEPWDPYYNIVFERGISYLVDDSKVDGEPDSLPLQYLGPYPIEVAAFDSLGRRVGAS